MQQYENAHHEQYIRAFNNNHARYQYAHDGLMSRIMSRSIIESKNPILRFVVSNIEQQLIFIMRYVDELKFFKQFLHKNY